MFEEYSDNSLIYEVFHVGSKRKCRLVQVYKSFTVKMGRSINVLGYMGTNGREVCVKLGWDVKRKNVKISIMLGNFFWRMGRKEKEILQIWEKCKGKEEKWSEFFFDKVISWERWYLFLLISAWYQMSSFSLRQA